METMEMRLKSSRNGMILGGIGIGASAVLKHAGCISPATGVVGIAVSGIVLAVNAYNLVTDIHDMRHVEKLVNRSNR